MCLSVHRSICVEKKNQLDAAECFIALMICSTCFGHFYAHHQELETICVLLPSMVCSAWLLIVGGQVQGSKLCVRDEGCCTTESCNIPLPRRIASKNVCRSENNKAVGDVRSVLQPCQLLHETSAGYYERYLKMFVDCRCL